MASAHGFTVNYSFGSLTAISDATGNLVESRRAGISLVSSFYDYKTWDKYSTEERFNIIQNKYEGINMEYDPDLTVDAQWDQNTGTMRIGKSGLAENKGWAKSGVIHELQHKADYNSQKLPSDASIYEKWGRTEFDSWLETRAYASELKNALNNNYNTNQWHRMVGQYTKYNGLIGNANSYNPRTYFLLLVLNNF